MSVETPRSQAAAAAAPAAGHVPGTPPLPTTPWRRVVGAMIMPVFFVVMFALCYVSAFHAPRPNDAPLVLVGASETTDALSASLAEASPGSFDVTATTSLDHATELVLHREAIGAVVVGETSVDVYTASAAGPIASGTVTQVGQQVAAESGLTVHVHDLAPLPPSDGTGTALFYFLIISTIAGYLTITVLSQVAPRQRLSHRYGVLAVASVALPSVALALISVFVGSFGGAGIGAIAATLAIGMVYCFAVGSVSILAGQLVGQLSILLVMTVAIFLNFPSSGGAIPASFLPDFWQALHSFWIGSSAMEPIRAVVYFGGHGVWPWLARLAGWLVVSVGLSVALDVRTRRRAAAAEVATATAEIPAQPSDAERTAPLVGATV